MAITTSRGIIMTQATTLRTLVDDLVNQKLLEPLTAAQLSDELATSSTQSPTPWFINLLIVISAWLSVIPFLIFLYAANLVGSSTIIDMGIGIFLLVATTFLHYVHSKNLFFNQLALALNLVGQTLFIVSLLLETQDITIVALATLGLQIVLMGVYQDSLLRFLAILIATIAILVIIYEYDSFPAIHALIFLTAAGAAWCWIRESRHLTHNIMASLYQPLGYGFVIALQTVLIFSILPNMDLIPVLSWWWSALGLTIILLIVEYLVLLKNDIQIHSVTSYAIFASTLIVAFLLSTGPGIIAAIIVLLLGFQRGNRLLMGIAFIFLTIFLVAYYYHLDITLFLKSITLISSGLVLLALRFMFKHVLPLTEGGS
jgi:hypothetical protein